MLFANKPFSIVSSSNTSHSSGGSLECDFWAVDSKAKLGLSGRFVVVPDAIIAKLIQNLEYPALLFSFLACWQMMTEEQR
jgi:hypothetical protein